ncbi:MAG TPA: aspartate kinase [Candidatus Pelagibacter bacterium]|jgi:aspartate kinase|nr:aspartate kinase [Candidatus Pelagibacter bacterium]|tara:strand:+ start:2087 stop:3301 length:1215 start_codon:yes stop_codon:yes gene_type:complete
MKIVVLKFGGTSVGTIDRIKKVTNIITKYVKKKYKVIVVSSAMSGATNDLVNKSKNISNNFSNAEYDVLVSSGEQVACALIAGRLIHKGYKSRSWMGWQIPIITDNNHKYSIINQVYRRNIIKYLKSGGIPIVTGFQGINGEGRVTTIGRGGSDASAIIMAKFFKAEKCIIYTDVEGVYTTDPKKLKKAKKIRVISYEEMLEMASLGAKVMQPTSIQDARLSRIDIEVKSSFKNKSGTLITKRKNIINHSIITGISSTQNDAKVTLVGIKDKPGVAASIFKPLSESSINVDMVVQNISANGKETDLTFTIKSDDLSKTRKITNSNKKIKYKKLLFDKNVSKVSIIGVGMITTPGVTYRMFQALAKHKINIQVISTSEIKISVLIDKKNIKKAIVALHKEFKLEV